MHISSFFEQIFTSPSDHVVSDHILHCLFLAVGAAAISGFRAQESATKNI